MPEGQASPRQQLEAFIDRYPPAVASTARAALRKLRARVPGAVQLVYDNYNALVIGFGPTDRAGACGWCEATEWSPAEPDRRAPAPGGGPPGAQENDAVLSLALYPRWVNLFFLKGAALPDPQRLLRGSGSTVRRLRLGDPGILDTPVVGALVSAALKQTLPIPSHRRSRIVIKAISARQRPRTRLAP